MEIFRPSDYWIAPDILFLCEAPAGEAAIASWVSAELPAYDVVRRDGGSYAQAKVHNLVRQDILAGDCRDLDVFLTNHFTTLNHINFGPQTIEVTVRPPHELNLLERIQIDSKLYTEVGLEFPAEYWYNTYRVPAPER